MFLINRMNSELNLKSIVLTFFLLLSTTILNSQILKDSNSVALIKKGIDYVYNFKFDEADKVNQELIKLYPGHPLNYLFKGMITYWENYPLTPTSKKVESFESDMRKCICLLYTSPSPRDGLLSRMPSSA